METCITYNKANQVTDDTPLELECEEYATLTHGPEYATLINGEGIFKLYKNGKKVPINL